MNKKLNKQRKPGHKRIGDTENRKRKGKAQWRADKQ